MRVFLDTNVLVSAVHTRGLCADVLRACLLDHELVFGETVLSEFRQVVQQKLRIPEARADKLNDYFSNQGTVVREAPPLSIRLRDPSDLPVLAEAVAGSADVLITGDTGLLELGEKSPVRILSPRGFWELLRATPSP